MCTALVAKFQFAAYEAILRIAALSTSFGASRTVFISKPTEVDAQGLTISSPEALRPLTLCNCDCKVITAAICSGLRRYSIECDHPSQRCVTQCIVADNIFEIETAAVALRTGYSEDPGICLTDFFLRVSKRGSQMALLSGWHGMCRARGFGSCKPRKRKKFSLKTEDESHAKQPRVDDPTPPDPGGVQSSPPAVVPPSTSFEKVAENRFGKGGCELHRAGGHSGDRTRACEMGHESAGQHAQERGSKWMQHAGAVEKDRVVDEAPLEKDIGPSTARMSSLLDNAILTARGYEQELAEQEGLQTGASLV